MITTLKELKKAAHTYEARRITAELGYAIMLSQENSDCFREEVEAAIHFLKQCFVREGAITREAVAECEKLLMSLSDLAKSYTVYCASHSHIDMNWMWGYNETVAITLDTFRTMLKLLDEYPQFIFSQSQASTYAIVEKYDPALFARIQQAVKSGRWEVTAASWVESDRNMIGTESVVRHVLTTRKYFNDKFGLTADKLSLAFEPDAFGHSRYTPETLSKCGIRYYYHSRGCEDAYAYSWEAPSGAKLLAYRDFDWYNMDIETDFIEHVPVVCRQIPNRVCLKVYGVGDHGGGPTRKDIERLIDMATWPIAPVIRFSTYRAFYDELAKVWDRLPVKRDEHKFVFTGCYSSESRLKMANRHGEDRLYEAEAFAALNHVYVDGGNAPESFEEAWQCLLFNQFHDILPGSGVTETREYAMGKFQELLGYTYARQSSALRSLAAEIDTSAFKTLCDKSRDTSTGAGVGYYVQNSGCDRSSLTITPVETGCGETRIFHVFNPSPFERQEVVRLVVWDYPDGLDNSIEVIGADGEVLPFSVGSATDYWSHKSYELDVFVTVPAMGYSTCVIRRVREKMYVPRPSIEERFEPFTENVLENELLCARFNDRMQLVSLIDKRTGKEWIAHPTAELILRESSGYALGEKHGDAWHEGTQRREVSLNMTQAVTCERIEHTALGDTLTYSLYYSHSRILVKASLLKGASMITFQVDVEWAEIGNEQCIPSLHFQVDLPYACDRYRYEIANGILDRPACSQHAVPSRSFICGLPENGEGLALFCDSQYGYTGRDNAMRVTLLRASQYPGKWPEIGAHTYRLGLAITDTSPIELNRLSHILTHPLAYITNTAHEGNLSLSGELFTLSGSVVLSSVRPGAEAGTLICRLYSIIDQEQDAAIKFSIPIQSSWLMSGDEQMIKQCDLQEQTLSIHFAPYELQTVKVYCKWA